MGRKRSNDPTTPVSARMNSSDLKRLDELVELLKVPSRTDAIVLAVRMAHIAANRRKTTP